MKGYNFKTSVQFRYTDFDMLGHLNSAQYLTFFELGRINYFKKIEWNLKDVSNVVASFTIDYLNQVTPKDEADIWIKVISLGNKSFKMEYLLASPNQETIYAKASSTQVCILKKDNSSTPIPAEIKQLISTFEGL